mmetsp:Transcript_27675/g.58520  ORF Transcript_27675/g.58520 Transcript_27675/m.58520 type:complete len:241 (+) Transcript_27675:658-1380(+)
MLPSASTAENAVGDMDRRVATMRCTISAAADDGEIEEVTDRDAGWEEELDMVRSVGARPVEAAEGGDRVADDTEGDFARTASGTSTGDSESVTLGEVFDIAGNFSWLNAATSSSSMSSFSCGGAREVSTWRRGLDFFLVELFDLFDLADLADLLDLADLPDLADLVDRSSPLSSISSPPNCPDDTVGTNTKKSSTFTSTPSSCPPRDLVDCGDLGDLVHRRPFTSFFFDPTSLDKVPSSS